MATVTKKFKENFDAWANDRLRSGEFTEADMEELKALLRKDLQPGTDQLRQGLVHFDAAGIEHPSTIDDHEERYRLWDGFFAEKARSIGVGA